MRHRRAILGILKDAWEPNKLLQIEKDVDKKILLLLSADREGFAGRERGLPCIGLAISSCCVLVMLLKSLKWRAWGLAFWPLRSAQG